MLAWKLPCRFRDVEIATVFRDVRSWRHRNVRAVAFLFDVNQTHSASTQGLQVRKSRYKQLETQKTEYPKYSLWQEV